jgi:hypothetical protein
MLLQGHAHATDDPPQIHLKMKYKTRPKTVQNGGAKVIGAKRACKFGAKRMKNAGQK